MHSLNPLDVFVFVQPAVTAFVTPLAHVPVLIARHVRHNRRSSYHVMQQSGHDMCLFTMKLVLLPSPHQVAAVWCGAADLYCCSFPFTPVPLVVVCSVVCCCVQSIIAAPAQCWALQGSVRGKVSGPGFQVSVESELDPGLHC
jgi:hypothetical protein